MDIIDKIIDNVDTGVVIGIIMFVVSLISGKDKDNRKNLKKEKNKKLKKNINSKEHPYQPNERYINQKVVKQNKDKIKTNVQSEKNKLPVKNNPNKNQNKGFFEKMAGEIVSTLEKELGVEIKSKSKKTKTKSPIYSDISGNYAREDNISDYEIKTVSSVVNEDDIYNTTRNMANGIVSENYEMTGLIEDMDLKKAIIYSEIFQKPISLRK